MKKCVLLALIFIISSSTFSSYSLNRNDINFTFLIDTDTIALIYNILATLPSTLARLPEILTTSKNITANVQATSSNIKTISDIIQAISTDAPLHATQITICASALILIKIGIQKLTEKNSNEKSKKQRWSEALLTIAGAVLLVNNNRLAQLINKR